MLSSCFLKLRSGKCRGVLARPLPLEFNQLLPNSSAHLKKQYETPVVAPRPIQHNSVQNPLTASKKTPLFLDITREMTKPETQPPTPIIIPLSAKQYRENRNVTLTDLYFTLRLNPYLVSEHPLIMERIAYSLYETDSESDE